MSATLSKFKRMVAWATGDRAREAEAILEEKEAAGSRDLGEVREEGVSEPRIAEHIEDEVRRNHGDLGDGTKNPEDPDVADVDVRDLLDNAPPRHSEGEAPP